ncbi:MAG: EAL domain-containing protein [Magnetococcales bacterium]|nr:EAL domain-containing protein [Magnetococcales bacterium]
MRGARKLRLLVAIGLLALVIMVSLVGIFHRQVMTGQILELGEKNHLVLSRALANGLWTDLEPFIHLVSVDPDAVQAMPETARLLERLKLHTRDLPIIKLKLYNRQAVTVFATDLQKIGEDQSVNAGVVAALEGRITSKLHLGEQVRTTDGVLEDRSILESYLPMIHGSGPAVDGVFELYQDVTPLLARIRHSQWQEIITSGTFVTIFVILFSFVILRLRRDVAVHEENRRQFIERIQHDKEDLEKRVAERTRELTRTNQALKIEVEVRRQAEQELCLAASVYQNTTEGILVTDPRGMIESVNPACITITGYCEEEVIHKPMSQLFSAQHDEAFYRHIEQELAAQGRWHGEMWGQRKNGTIFPQFANISVIRDGDGRVSQFVLIFTDLSSIKSSEQQLHFLVHHDALTGLPNRLLLKDRMRQTFSYAVRFNQIVGILFLGLDRFTVINEAVGRGVGDRILRDVALRLANCLRDEDSLARVGGDEFVILATGLHQGGNAGRIARKLLSALSEPVIVESERYYLSASIGIALYPVDEGDEDAHLKMAESAMRRAKEQGGNAVHYFTKEIDSVSAKRMAIENGLRLALERGELFLNYQPQIHVVTGRLMGVEALIRWKSPELGLVSPVNFIPIAEESDLISAIGDWVLRTACQQNMLWQEEGFAPIRMAVNLSARQFQNRDLPDKVSRILQDTGLNPRYLELELTEGMFMRDVNETVATLRTLKAMNLQLSIDDFGTGYSSLSYLKRFPIHTLKIDRAFVRDIIADPDDAAITKTIISMAKNLNLQVVAEGVASPDQLEFLRSLGCDLVQGFLFSPPVGPEEIALFLDEDRAYGERSTFSPKFHSTGGALVTFPESGVRIKEEHNE